VPGLADLEALVSLEPVQRVAVLIREDRDRLGAELDRRPATPDEARELLALRGRAPAAVPS